MDNKGARGTDVNQLDDAMLQSVISADGSIQCLPEAVDSEPPPAQGTAIATEQKGGVLFAFLWVLAPYFPLAETYTRPDNPSVVYVLIVLI